MSTVELFGTVAVTLMVVFYGLEPRSPIYVLLFAAACLASAGYALAIQSWPFATVESLWSVLALRRWFQATRSTRSSNTPQAP